MIPKHLIAQWLDLAQAMIADGTARDDPTCIRVGGFLAVLAGVAGIPPLIGALLPSLESLGASIRQHLQQVVAAADARRN
jgi:hypothetical protein